MSDPGASLFDRITGRSQTAAGRLRVRSALNPMLWLCGIVSPLSFGAALLARGREPLTTMFFAIGAIPILVACAQAVYFGIWRPEKLQSEEYQIRHEALELIKEKGSGIEVSPSSLEAIANPVHPLPRLGGAR